MDSIRYKKEIKNIKEYAIKNNVSEEQVNKVFQECFYLLEVRTSTRITNALKFLKLCSIIILIIISSVLILYNHPKTHNILLRNLQNFIYPGLRVLRKLAVPIITTYPSLTGWYDEWCLVENPYFQVNEMDCWPCSSVNAIQDLTAYNITPGFNIAAPFTRLEKTEVVDMNRLFQTYTKYRDTFNEQAEHVISNKPYFRTIRNVMNEKYSMYPFSEGNAHIEWRINRMEPGRKLRKLFPKLPGIPDWWSPSTDKFLLIDEPKAPNYNLPSPECANIIVQCTNGERIIQLNPSPECTGNCKKMRILLSAHQSLWYNWWYWRPISLPSNNTSITVMYLTSYC